MWRSLVARQLWELMVAGSNPAIPMQAPVMELGRHLLLSPRVYAGSSPVRGTWLATNFYLCSQTEDLFNRL